MLGKHYLYLWKDVTSLRRWLIFLLNCSTVELKDNTIIIVLGASGDLAKKKTVRTSFLLELQHMLIR